MVDGTELATCRMYDGWADLRDGYAKSLWAAFGSPGRRRRRRGPASAWPTSCRRPPPLLRRSRVGLAGYAVAVAGRAAVARDHRITGLAGRAGPSRLDRGARLAHRAVAARTRPRAPDLEGPRTAVTGAAT